MGLFTFLKSVGTNLFGRDQDKGRIDAAEAQKQRIQQLEKRLADFNFDIENLSIDLKDDTVSVFGQTKSQSEKEKVVLALGNIEGISTVDDRISVLVKEPEAKFYEVRRGDTLSKIARAFYGDPMKYPVIFEANKPMLKNPDLIYPGQVLRIPDIDTIS